MAAHPPGSGRHATAEQARRHRARPTALGAFRRARRTFLDGDRIDMQALASASTLTGRPVPVWAGSGDQLLTEIP